MFFRNGTLLWESFVWLLLALGFGFFLITTDNTILDWILLFALVMPAFVMCAITNERICIDEKGITCTRGKKIIWQYKWCEIAALKKSTHCRTPIIAIILTPDCTTYSPEAGNDVPYFVLSRKAKKVMQQRKIKVVE